MDQGEYRFDPESFTVTDEMTSSFHNLGFILVRGLLDAEEVKLVEAVLQSDAVQREVFGVPDADGLPMFVAGWNQPGNDVTGMVARSEKVAGTAEKLMGGEVYHYQTKVTMKDPYNGGRFEWHQDYGYWYKNGLLFPDCMTVIIAVDRCTKGNGCLQILTGSNNCGRIDHIQVNGQSKADDNRVEQIKKRCRLRYVEMEPGDAVFFHSNTLHYSEQNTSPHRRWVMGCCYNRASNNPTQAHHHSSYVPMEMVPNSAIKNCKTPEDLSGKNFLDPSKIKKGQLRYIRRGESLAKLKG